MKKVKEKTEKKDKKESKFKKFIDFFPLIFIGIIILLVIVMIIFSLVNKSKLQNEEKTYQKRKEMESKEVSFKKEYEELNGKTNDKDKKYPEVLINADNKIKYTSYKEINEILDKKSSAVIYMGFSKCPWCRNAVPVLLQASEATSIKNILYLDIKDDRNELELQDGQIKTIKEGKKEYNDLVERINDKLDVYDGLNDNTIKRIYAPTVLFIKNGEVLSIHTSTVDSQTDPYIALDKAQRKELYDIYKKGILSTLDSECTEEAC